MMANLSYADRCLVSALAGVVALALYASAAWFTLTLTVIVVPPSEAHIQHGHFGSVSAYTYGAVFDRLISYRPWLEALLPVPHPTVSAYWAQTSQGASGLLSILLAAVIVGGCSAGVFAWRVAQLIPGRPRYRIVKGRTFAEGQAATARLKAELRPGRRPAPLEIAPKVYQGAHPEEGGIGIVGSQASGKTIIVRRLIRQLHDRGDRLIILDEKGVFTEQFPGDAVLLSPGDARSWAWDVARDIDSGDLADALAHSLIPDSKEPIWSEGARLVLAGVVRALQAKKPGAWSWGDIAETLLLPTKDLTSLLERHYPVAARLLQGKTADGSDSPTSNSFTVSTLAPVFQLLSGLIDAWEGTPPEYRLSLREWLDGRSNTPKTLILQRHADKPDFSERWLRGVFETLSRRIGSPKYKADPSIQTWFVMDEFAQIKLDSFKAVLEVGREKNARAIITLQSIDQLTENYGEAGRDVYLNLLSTRIVLNLAGSPANKTICDHWIGTQEISFFEETIAGDGTKRVREVSRTQDVVHPSELSRLRKQKNGVEGLLIAHTTVGKLVWPYENWPAQRPAFMPERRR
ncbi:type IV secretion system DNA-binding domain-containing protein [Amorphus orientalis]|uniref:GTPase SAR1 family protein n=1 Tax=Amorphus orientalis TaxID=649198 RepID=A0AAE3VMQ4_9HYPH|nr:type IV secretion system DNA-binding domain-containing protein [Amorphus orientalis]MDQ0314881.1 GTPase SAR1 family protein [Amorphus orientalis]